MIRQNQRSSRLFVGVIFVLALFLYLGMVVVVDLLLLMLVRMVHLHSLLLSKRRWGWCGQVSSLGLESVLIGNVGEGDGMAMLVHVGDGALLYQRLFVFVALVLYETVLFRLDSIAGFVATICCIRYTPKIALEFITCIDILLAVADSCV